MKITNIKKMRENILKKLKIKILMDRIYIIKGWFKKKKLSKLNIYFYNN
jgi:hypothetical protein